MQKHKEKALPLITIDNRQQYVVGEEARHILTSTTGKIAVISVAGMYRTGKSYLLNRMLLNRSDGFGVGPTINPCTKGLWLWGRPILHRNALGQTISIFIVDSEGMGACQEDSTHDCKIFALTLLLSSCFIYNSMGNIDENAIASLGLVTKLCQHLKASTSTQNRLEQTLCPQFFWVVRDFSLQLVDKNGESISDHQYLENCLKNQSDKDEGRNQIRKAIKEYFPKRNCVTLVRPLMNEENLQMLDKMQYDQLRPQFVQQLINLRKNILNHIQPKALRGGILNGKALCDMINCYVQSVNSGAVPVIDNVWEYICRNECEDALQQAIDFFQGSLSEKGRKRLPLTKEEFKKLKEEMTTEAIKMFDSLSGSQRRNLPSNLRQNYISQLNDTLQKHYNHLKAENLTMHLRQTQAFLSGQYDYIDKKMRNNEYRRIVDYVKEQQLFYDYYRKKCPNQPAKAKIYVLEFLQKKLSQGALIMGKHSQNQIESLKSKISDFQVKLQKDTEEHASALAKQKKLFMEKQAALQQKIVENQNARQFLSQQFNRLKSQYDSMAVEKDKIEANFKKQTVRLQNELRRIHEQSEETVEQLQKQHSQALSTLERQNLLISDRLEHTAKRLTDCEAKLKSNEAHLTQVKQSWQTQRKDMQKQQENIRNSLHNRIRVLESQLEEARGQVNSLQHFNYELSSIREEQQKKLKDVMREAETKLKEQYDEQQLESDRLHDKFKRQRLQIQRSWQLRLHKAQQQQATKDNQLKSLRLQAQKELAVLRQQLNFNEAELSQRDHRIRTLDHDYQKLLALLHSKQQLIADNQTIIQQHKQWLQTQKLSREDDRRQAQQTMTDLRRRLDTLSSSLQQEQSSHQQQQQLRHEVEASNHELMEQLRQSQSHYRHLLQQRQAQLRKTIKQLENDIQTEKEEATLRIQENQQNAEQSLGQLKMFYELERQRLEKKLLQQRQKYERLESEEISLARRQYEEYRESAEAETARLTDQMRDMQLKIRNIEQAHRNQKQQHQVTIVELQKEKQLQNDKNQHKITQLQQEITRCQHDHLQQRNLLIRKIQTITSQMSRKEKQLLQLSARKDTAQMQLLRRQESMQNIQRELKEDIQQQQSKNQELKAKLTASKQAYLQLKIQSQKELALTKQKNEFLSAKVAELVREREQILNRHNIDRTTDRSESYKQHIQKLTQELAASQNRSQTLRRNLKDTEIQHGKQLSQFQRQKTLLLEKLSGLEHRNKELQGRSATRSEQHIKDIDEMRQRYGNERELHSSENQKLRQQLLTRQSDYDELHGRYLKQTALLCQKLKFAQHQKQQLRRQLDDGKRKLDLTMSQFQRRGQVAQEQELKRQLMQQQQKLQNQLDSLRQQLRRKQEQLDEVTEKLKLQQKQSREKQAQMQQRLLKDQRSRKSDELLIVENEKLKRERDELFLSHRAQLQRQNEEHRKKMAQVEKKYKAVEKKNAEFNFILQKQHAKWTMEKDSLVDRINQLEQALTEKTFLQKSMEMEVKRSSSGSRFQDSFSLKKSGFTRLP